MYTPLCEDWRLVRAEREQEYCLPVYMQQKQLILVDEQTETLSKNICNCACRRSLSGVSAEKI
jgi:hypothetical protein